MGSRSALPVRAGITQGGGSGAGERRWEQRGWPAPSAGKGPEQGSSLAGFLA